MAAGATTHVVVILQRHGTHEILTELSLDFLLGIFKQVKWVENSTTSSIHEEGGIAPVVSVMNRHPDSDAIQRLSALVLLPLAGYMATRDDFVEQDAIPAVLHVMAKLPGDAELQYAGCLSLSELVENGDSHVKDEIKESGGMTFL